ncbi:hypothetical protein KEG38_43275 [Polyangium jinanense]|uniref:hypothetical protein n=1 Tax=Polyangium jinanense TaxID=2829994 RepID=UPI0023427E66|nr:hypothetical protein [Polyangium jinanense]MDC3960754.1 hypothetical protein [Polyangium jinanense]
MARLFGRDIFDHRLPLKSDTYFFGREALIQEFQQAFLAGENRGLFGLRKTGKTSFLYKLQRMSEGHSALCYLYYDCKSPTIRTLRWTKLLKKIANDMATALGIHASDMGEEPAEAAEAFMRVACRAPDGQTPVLVFDEVEYISPFAKLDKHWEQDYVPFWQTIWSAQSAARALPTLVCGVSPAVVEQDLVGGVQNPLFGIVPARYLTGLGNAETRRMLLSLGSRIGLKFTDDAATYLYQRYGGHPFLTRLACSAVHRALQAQKVPRPITIDRDQLINGEEQRDGELAYYCGHVVSELKEFYPDEYSLLENIATGQLADYFDFYRQPEFVTHLSHYGLLQRAPNSVPQISIPVVGHYVGLQAARAAGRRSILHVIPVGSRKDWLGRRIRAIIDDIRALEGVTRRPGATLLFGPNSFPEADKLLHAEVAENETSFATCVNILNRCFVEPIEKYGLSIGKKNYFWDEVKAVFPSLWDALCRIKIYRHDRVHIVLNPSVSDALDAYLNRDLEGRTPGSVDGLWFVLQQCTLDNLFLGIQAELERFS